MSELRSGALAAWAAAFFAGRVSIDQAADAVARLDGAHTVVGLPGTHPEVPTPLRDLLVALRRAGGGVRAVLPVAGDVRGLAGPPGFRDAALDAGEAVRAGELGAVPSVIDYAPSSAPTSVSWHAWAVPGELAAPPDEVAVADAQFELATAIRECASALAAADVAGGAADLDTLHRARRAGERLNLPPGFPPRAVALVAQAERMQEVLDLALADPVGGAVDRAGIAARSSALRPLVTAVRRARLAGYNAEAHVRPA